MSARKTQLEVPVEVRARLREVQARLERERDVLVTVPDAIVYLLDAEAEAREEGKVPR